MKKITDKTKSQIEKILNLLKEPDVEEKGMHVRGIARAAEMHPMKVSYIVDHYLYSFLEIVDINQFGIKAKIVRLKEGKENLTLKDVLDYLEAKKRIRV